MTWDAIVVGAGTAGLPTAIAAVERGARVLLLEKSDRVGGTLHVSAGQMTAAGTRLQQRKGIADSADAHYADIMRISKSQAHPLFARMMVEFNPRTIDWLTDRGFEFDPAAAPTILHYHEAHSIARTYWGIDGGRSVLKVLERWLEPALATGRLDLRFHAEAKSLLQDACGAVSGVVARIAGVEQALRGKNVVLATGGYGANAELFRELSGAYPLYTATMPTSTGDGLKMGIAAGGSAVCRDTFLPTFGGFEERDAPGRVSFADSPRLTPQMRAPWELFVNLRGERFVAEDHPSVDARERTLMRQPELTFWIVYDERARQEAPPLIPGWDERKLVAAFDDHRAFRRAGDVSALADACALDRAALARTIDTYNAAVASGSDTLGRKHLPAPIAQPPFYAIRNHGVVLRTVAGLAVDTQLQVIDERGEPIPSLFAAGEILGSGIFGGDAFVGGSAVTPALGFGRWLGGERLKW